MKRYVVVILAVCFSIYMFGCAKKQSSLDESQEPMSMEQLGTLKTQGSATELKPQMSEAAVQVSQTVLPAGETKLEPLPPSGSFKPTSQQIQTALRNAGFYSGIVDGKMGPMTRKAIEEFQKANGLKVDGKIGPKTWSLLSAHAEAAATNVSGSKGKSNLKRR